MKIKRNCLVCNSGFYPLSAEVNRGRGKVCSVGCRYKYQSEVLMGHIMKPSAKVKLIKALTGRKRSKSHSENIARALKGNYIGKDNGNWRGGKYLSQGRWF